MLFIPMKSYTFYMPLLFGGYAETRLRYSGSFTTAASYCSRCSGKKYKNKNRPIRFYSFDNDMGARANYCSKCVKELLTRPVDMNT